MVRLRTSVSLYAARVVLAVLGIACGVLSIGIIFPFTGPTRVDLSGQGLTSSPNAGALTYYFEPSAGSTEVWEPEWLHARVENHINSNTLNEQREYDREKPTGTYRIVILGDSYTYGHFVPVEDNYTEVLERKLNESMQCPGVGRFEILNLGVPGYDIAYSVERLRKRGVVYHPDLVIWLVNYWNMQTINEERLPLQEAFVKKGIPVFNEKTRTNDAVIMAMDSIRKKFGMTGILAYQQKQLDKLPDIYQGKLLLFSLPGMNEKEKEVVRIAMSKLPGYSYWESSFDYFGSPEFQLYDHHPNALGHTRIAEELYAHLRVDYFSGCVSE